MKQFVYHVASGVAGGGLTAVAVFVVVGLGIAPGAVPVAADEQETSMIRPMSGQDQAAGKSVSTAQKDALKIKEVTRSRETAVVQSATNSKNAIVMVRTPRNGASDMLGTGVIIDEHGFIITNKHVVGDAKNLVVVLSDNTKIPAEVVIGEAACDLAILRMRTTKKFSVLRLAPVDDLMVGETVIAVGDPFGYAWSVSSGVISALNRDVKMPSGDTLTGMIQISAPINPGNSGGPLLNINGELIGIIVALREGSQNIAFAINSGTAENFLRKHLSSARVSGIEHGLACIDKTIAATGDRRRVFVAWFQGEGDIRKGDEIVSAGHKVVKSLFDLERAFWGCKPGESVEMKIVREGREMTISLTVAASNGTGEKTGSLPKAVSHPAEK